MKALHLLSGLPHSGSTILAAVLNQHPAVHVDAASGLAHILDGLASTWVAAPLLGGKDPERQRLVQVLRGVVAALYAHTSKPIVIDKSYNWLIPTVLDAMDQVLRRPCKVIATARSIPDCAASYVRAAQPTDLSRFIAEDHFFARLRAAYLALQASYKARQESFCIVDYDDLVANPRRVLDKIHAFLELEPFTYDLTAIADMEVVEDDENPLTPLAPRAVRLALPPEEPARVVLGQRYSEFCQPEFWMDKPKTVRRPEPIDQMLAAGLRGDFEEGWRLGLEILEQDPANDRAAFNLGWYYLRQGKVQRGYQLMERGRRARVFGNPRPPVPTPDWDGRSKGIVLLYLEGGLGDQIHQVRYAKDIAARGCRVVVACSRQLSGILRDVAGVAAIVQHEAVPGVHHDYLVQGMSAVVPLGHELPDLSGAPYINRPTVIKGDRRRIGIRWAGNPQFEHEQHRSFPPQLMFDALVAARESNVDIISLQRDHGAERRPGWARQVKLDTWEDTREAIAGCDLVITSCTSVSHLAAAMGVPTWVILPVLPYYLYALDGERTPYYDSMRLFRQKVFGNWAAPFEQIKAALEEVLAAWKVT